MKGLHKPVVAIRWDGRKHGFNGIQDMNQIDAIAEMNTSALIHDATAGIMKLDKKEVLLAEGLLSLVSFSNTPNITTL